MTILIYIIILFLITLTGGYLFKNFFKVKINDSVENIILSFGIGYGLLIYLMIFFGVLKFYNVYTFYIILLLLSFISFLYLKQSNFSKNAFNLKYIFNYFRPHYISILIFLYLVLYFLVSLSPTLEGDSISSYLVIPNEFVKYGGIKSVDFAYSNGQPGNGQMISSFGLLIKNQILAQILVVFSPMIIFLGTIFLISKAYFDKNTAVLSILIWLGSYSVGYLAASAKIDLVWAMFDLLSIYLLFKWYFSENIEDKSSFIFLSGFFLGLALGTKLASIFTLVITLLFIVYRLRQKNLNTIIKTMFIYFIPLIPTVFWFYHSFICTGSLVYSGDNLVNENNVFGFLKVLWQMSMSGNTPSVVGHHGKSIGPAILAILPLSFLYKLNNKYSLILLYFSSFIIIFWFFGVQRARHLLPVLGLLSVISGFYISQLSKINFRFSNIILTCVLFSATINLVYWSYINFYRIDRMKYIFGMEDKEMYLKKNLAKRKWPPNYELNNFIKYRLPLNAKIGSLGGAMSFYADKPIYSYWHDKFNKLDMSGYIEKLKNDRITHVWINNYGISIRKLGNAWLNDKNFKDKYLSLIFEHNDQYLYKIN